MAELAGQLGLAALLHGLAAALGEVGIGSNVGVCPHVGIPSCVSHLEKEKAALSRLTSALPAIIKGEKITTSF